MQIRRSQMSTGLALAAMLAFLAAPAFAQRGSEGGGGAHAGGPAGGSGGGGGSASGGMATASSGGGGGGVSSAASSGGGTSSGFSGTSSSPAVSGSGPSGVRGAAGVRDAATGGGGVVVGRAVHGSDTFSYRSPNAGAFTYSDRTTGRSVDSSGRNADTGNVPAYSRPRDGATVTGSAVPRGSVPTQPPAGSIGYPYYGYGYPFYGYGSYPVYGYGLGYASCDPFNMSAFGLYGACGSGYGSPYASGYYDPFYGSTMMGAFSADPWYGGSSAGSSAETWTPDAPDDATLRLKIKPSKAEVFVDGYFVGVVDDFNGMFQKLHIEAGPHRIEVRAAGYETLDLDIRLTSGKTTVYQGELTKIQ